MRITAKKSRMDVCYLNTSVLKFNPTLADPGFGSDVVILDLEDGVHNSAKAKAREVIAALDLTDLDAKDLTFGVRVNSLCSIDGIRDIDVIYTCLETGSLAVDFLQIPKVRSHHDVLLYRELLEKLPVQIRIMPIIETPEAVENVDRIAALSDAMMFGQVDMAASMYQVNEAYLAYARGRFCVACAREGIAAIDTAAIDSNMELMDMAAFEKECVAGKADGFTAKAVIHPVQVPIVKKVFGICEDELEQYRSTISRYQQTEEGFSIVDGRVIAPPFVARARMMLRLYGVESAATSMVPTLANSSESVR